MPASKPDHWNDGIRPGASYMHIGIQSALTVVVFTGGGILADGWLDTSPWLTLVGALIGVIGLFSILLRAAQTLGNPPSNKPPSA
ncbi:MAG: AtpZ/AtpI family protein [Bacteroidota bacterium]